MSNLEHFVMPKRKTSLKKLVILGSISQEKSASLKRLPPAKSGLLGGGSGVQSVSRVQLCNPMDCSTPGFPILHYLPEFAQIHGHWVSDAIQPPHPLPPSSPFAPNLSQHHVFFQWVSSSHQVAKLLELQLQYQSFQWIFRTDFL